MTGFDAGGRDGDRRDEGEFGGSGTGTTPLEVTPTGGQDVTVTVGCDGGDRRSAGNAGPPRNGEGDGGMGRDRSSGADDHRGDGDQLDGRSRPRSSSTPVTGFDAAT